MALLTFTDSKLKVLTGRKQGKDNKEGMES